MLGELRIAVASKGTNGRVALNVSNAEQSIYVGELNLTKKQDRDSVINDICEQYPGIDREGMEKDLLRLAADYFERATRKTPEVYTPPGQPIIVANNRQLPEITSDVMKAMAEHNSPPTLYTRGGAPARIRSKDDGKLVIEQLNETELRHCMARRATFYRVGKGGEMTAVPPPMDVVKDSLALEWNQYKTESGSPSFPPLDAITDIPTMRPNGTITQHVGYDASTRLFYDRSPTLDIPEIPATPTRQQLCESVDLINDGLGEFPFATDADYANALGTLITPAVRPSIDGKSPMALFDAPQAGNGKSLLADAITTINIGSSPALMGAPADDSEWRKQITATLLDGPCVIVVDNVNSILSSPSLARAITANKWSDRILSTSEQVNLVIRAMWIATGNNIELGGDMPRRCYRVRLDAKTSRPWRGREFRHPNLLEWIGRNRGRLVWAILTLCRAWHVAGKPPAPNTPVIGSFESWCKTVGGILHFAGVTGFLGNLDDLYEQSDDGAAGWEKFLAVWQLRYGTDEIPVCRLITDLQSFDGSELRNSLPDDLRGFVVCEVPRHLEAGQFIIKDCGRFGIKLGKQLRQRVGRRYGVHELHLIRRDDLHAKTKLWSVQSAGSAGNAGSVFIHRGGQIDSNSPEISDFSVDLGKSIPATTRTTRDDPPTGDSRGEGERGTSRAVKHGTPAEK